MSGSMVEVLKTTPRMGRRSMALIDIDNKYVSQSGIWEASEVETSKGSIRIQHLTAVAQSLRSVSSGSGATSIVGGPPSNPRFPKLEECAHFHYDYVELPLLKILIREDTSKSITLPVDEATDKCAFAIEVSAGGQSWVIRRTHKNFIFLDEILHRCCLHRSFSRLEDLKNALSTTKRRCKGNIGTSTTAAASRRRTTTTSSSENLVVTDEDDEADRQQQHNHDPSSHEDESQQNENDHPDEEHNGCRDTIIRYLSRLAQLPTNKITCGTVLSWLELDNRGRHIVSSDDSDINTPAVAAACVTKNYAAQASDELSFQVGDMISVIDMPPPEESIWWRGKRGFHVGFFPRECVQVIGDKVPAGLPIISSVRRLQRLSVSSAPASSTAASSSAPEKPVLRKHGKLIAFFRSFILSRPSRRRLKQSGILRERVFSCDLAEHLLNTGNDIPAVLKCCAEFIEKRGIVDGIYRLSGITSNIQKLRNLFDEDKIPNLEDDMAIKQDIHAVSSLLKMYFRELPNPLCTYQLYDKFVTAAQASDEERLFKMREVVHELPPPHYRTLEYLMKHLARVAQRSNETGMTPKNMAIVWAPNLIRCKELEAGGVDALKGIGVQAVVTEYLVRHADLIFNDKLPANYPITTTVLSHKASCSSSGRPKSLAISSPIRLMSLEEAQDRQKQDDRKYIEVGGGPASLPPKYHTVIDLPSRRSALKNKRSPIGWRQFFSRNRSFSKPSTRKTSNPIEITVVTKSMPMAGPQGMQSNWAGRLRPVKSVESLVSSPMFTTSVSGANSNEHGPSSGHFLEHDAIVEDVESSLSKSSPATPVMTDVDVLFHAAPNHNQIESSSRSLQNPKTHNRSISHDSYFEFGEFRNGNRVYIDETLEEETLSQSSKLSLEMSSGGESPTRKSTYAKDSKTKAKRGGMMSPVTPPPSAASLVVPTTSTIMSESVTSTSSDDVLSAEYNNPKSPLLPSKWRDSEVQTSQTKLYDVGVCTQEDMDNCANFNTTSTNAVVSSATMTSFTSSEQQTTTSTSSSGVIRDNSEQSLISHSSSGYELDRNSSIDGSSVDSTPGEPFATTNIIYSPLVDDLSSPASSENHFKFGGSGMIDPFRVSSDSEASVKSSKKGSALYISPLYETGVVNTLESPSSAVSVGTEFTDVTTSSSVSPRVPVKNPYENVSVINTHNERNKPNFQVFLCSSSSSHSLDVKQEGPVSHVYENQRLYENQPPPVPAIRKSKSEGAVMSGVNNNTKIELQKPITSEICNVPPTLIQVTKDNDVELKSSPQYEQGQYENVGEIKVKPPSPQKEDELCSTTVSNIYEDIDGDASDDDDFNFGNKYETVEFEKGVMKPVERDNKQDDNEYEKVQKSPVVIHHHYAEIGERMDTTSDATPNAPVADAEFQTTTVFLTSSPISVPQAEETTSLGASSHLAVMQSKSEDSSPSHSHTEDIVTYLEVRNNSLDDQEEISQPSSDSGPGGKLSKMNSLNSDTPGNSPPVADEGEIRHIDSPINSPSSMGVAPGGVDNPLYGMPSDEVQEQETKDLDVQSDGEDMSVNESISISISIDETNTTPTSSSKQKNEQLSSTQNTSQDSQENVMPNGVGLKLVSRCNSAPISVSVHEFTVALDRNEAEKMSLDDAVRINGAGENGGNRRFSGHGHNINSGSSSAKDEIEKSFGEKILLCKRLSEPSLLFSNSSNAANCRILECSNGIAPQKTDSSSDSNNCGGGRAANAAAWKIADAKRLANRKQSVKELLSKFESSGTSPVQSPTSTNCSSGGGCGAFSLPPTGLSVSKTEISSSNTSIKDYSGKCSSNNSLNRSSNNSCSNDAGRFQHHRFSAGDILMSQSVSVVENLCGISRSAQGENQNYLTSTNNIVRSDTFPELSRDDSPSKENSLHDTYSKNRSGDEEASEKAPSSLRVAMSSVDMNDPSRRERIEKYKEERRSFLRQKINSELTAQQKPPSEVSTNGQILPSPKSPEVLETEIMAHDSPPCNNRTSESPRKRAFSDDCPSNGSTTSTNKSIKTDPFSLKCAFLASTTTTSSTTKLMETSITSGTSSSCTTETVSSSTMTKSVESSEEINVRERVAMWSSQKKESSNSSLTSSQSQVTTPTVASPSSKGTLSTSTTEFPKLSKPLLRRELTTSAIEQVSTKTSSKQLTKVGRTNSEGTKKIKDMAAFFEAKQF